MKMQRLLVVLTLLNFGLLLFLVVPIGPASADATTTVLRGRGLEIVDDQGRVRASIAILPSSVQPTGDRYPETVLLRLITERGRPSVKMAASEEAAGLTLVGPTNTKDTYAILSARGTVSSLRLRNEDGGEQTIKP